jgi:hypothetical protein
MNIKLHSGQAASEEAILRLETALGYRLSNTFRDFLRACDGAEPESNSFTVGAKNESGVRRFIPSDEILKERSYIDNLPPKAYPVAYDSCGNFIFVDEGRNGAVFFLDHELSEITEIAPTFGGFLADLKPFDITTVKLKPGQVKKVWIDPEFLKNLKKQ